MRKYARVRKGTVSYMTANRRFEIVTYGTAATIILYPLVAGLPINSYVTQSNSNGL